MKQRLFPTFALPAIAVVLLMVPHAAGSAEGDYTVIVHGQSPVTSVTAAELTNIYLKKTTVWRNGMEADPIDLVAGNPVRARFSMEILGRPVPAIQAHWRKAIFSGKAVPPIELPRDGDVLNYVSNHPGAVGYVSSATFMDAANVKRVKVTGGAF